MKTLNIFITEKLKNKYLIIYFKSKNRQAMYTNDYEHAINVLKADWYEVYDADKELYHSKVDSLIEFSGENSDIYKAIEKAEKSSDPKISKSDIEKLKSKYKE